MENQWVREQVFDVLFNYVKIADGIFTESDCATVRDEICLLIDQSQFTANEVEDIINHEVEKRIKERMPTGDEMKKRQKDRGDYLREMGYPPQVIAKYQDAIKETWEWLRNQINK